ncbi:hypothetical protein ACOTTU_07790 [Roseobacter sp. EG26]|uniref:hypothetical protein n=1 Tax=Roseobacter sp. EG26 TaxID=3412477 RepID=UPI003CE4B2B1
MTLGSFDDGCTISLSGRECGVSEAALSGKLTMKLVEDLEVADAAREVVEMSLAHQVGSDVERAWVAINHT